MDLSAIRRRCEAATKGRWEATHDIQRGVKIWVGGEPMFLVIAGLGLSHVTPEQPECEWRRNVDFVLAARTDIPALLAALDEATALLREARDFLRDFANDLEDEQAWTMERRSRGARVIQARLDTTLSRLTPAPQVDDKETPRV